MLDHTGAVLVVDDNENNRDILKRRLNAQGHKVFMAENGQQAMEVILQGGVDLVLLDIMMPVMNGYQVLDAVKANPELHNLPIIMITGVDETDSVVKCLELGAEDYLSKPFNSTILKARIKSSLEKKYLRDQEEMYRKKVEEYNRHLEQRVQEQVRLISDAQLAIIYAMAKLAEYRDIETGKHLERVREYCKIIVEELANQKAYSSVIENRFIENLYTASPLHDIGKVGIPDHILLKPGRLTPEEYNTMKAHTIIGAETLRAVDNEFPGNGFIKMGIEIAQGHHEKWDGSGYPNGLSKEDIPLSSRILALADVYDALTSWRVYKEPVTHAISCEVIMASRGNHLDPKVVDCFFPKRDEFQMVKEYFHDGR